MSYDERHAAGKDAQERWIVNLVVHELHSTIFKDG